MIAACHEAQILPQLIPIDIHGFLDAKRALPSGRLSAGELTVLEFIIGIIKEPRACVFFSRACAVLRTQFTEAHLRLALLKMHATQGIGRLSTAWWEVKCRKFRSACAECTHVFDLHSFCAALCFQEFSAFVEANVLH
jgi:hypothetical protein